MIITAIGMDEDLLLDLTEVLSGGSFALEAVFLRPARRIYLIFSVKIWKKGPAAALLVQESTARYGIY